MYFVNEYAYMYIDVNMLIILNCLIDSDRPCPFFLLPNLTGVINGTPSLCVTGFLSAWFSTRLANVAAKCTNFKYGQSWSI